MDRNARKLLAPSSCIINFFSGFRNRSEYFITLVKPSNVRSLLKYINNGNGMF